MLISESFVVARPKFLNRFVPISNLSMAWQCKIKYKKLKGIYFYFVTWVFSKLTKDQITKISNL
jgi:hypothetical protein